MIAPLAKVAELVDAHDSKSCTFGCAGSIPAFGTEESLFSIEEEAFFVPSRKLRQNTVPEKRPYKLATLVHHNYDMSKRWYVDFCAWDVSIDKLRRCRIYEPLNRIKSRSTRLFEGDMLVRAVNRDLRDGKVLGKDKFAEQSAKRVDRMNLLVAIEHVKEQKRLNGHRKSYYRTFSTLKTVLEGWLTFENQADFPLSAFSQREALSLHSYLRGEKKLANKTINNIFTNLATTFNYLEKRGKIWKVNPLQAIDTLPVHVKKHAAFTNEQITAIMNAIREHQVNAPVHRRSGYKQLELFIQFIYYALARPNEIMDLKVGDVQLDENRVFIRGEISKNKMDDYVAIPDKLKNSIKKSGVLKAKPGDFIFSKGGVPGATRLHDNFFWDKHKRILEETGLRDLNPNFSLYSYKHTGAISLYKATKDVKIVQQQCRHQSVAQTDAYLRDLGLHSNYDVLKGWTGAF